MDDKNQWWNGSLVPICLSRLHLVTIATLKYCSAIMLKTPLKYLMWHNHGHCWNRLPVWPGIYSLATFPLNPVDLDLAILLTGVQLPIDRHIYDIWKYNYPDSRVHGANMGPIWSRQDPGVPHVGPMNFAIWVASLAPYIYIYIYDIPARLVLMESINQRVAKLLASMLARTNTTQIDTQKDIQRSRLWPIYSTTRREASKGGAEKIIKTTIHMMSSKIYAYATLLKQFAERIAGEKRKMSTHQYLFHF